MLKSRMRSLKFDHLVYDSTTMRFTMNTNDGASSPGAERNVDYLTEQLLLNRKRSGILSTGKLAPSNAANVTKGRPLLHAEDL